MPNQIININPKETVFEGLFREDTIMIIADTSIGSFSSSMPEGFSQNCYSLTFYNIGTNDFNLSFKSSSLLYFNTGAVSSVSIGSGGSVNMFNETVSGKWRSITDPSVRLIWEDNRLKGQVYQDGAWHTCIKGGY
ncbi:MAG: hypothetical protein JXB48_21175 [Candidatus Latescibacteria bacterium]|nr:hypothetical protein [Candidatus Latescibacterota bacterium]